MKATSCALNICASAPLGPAAAAGLAALPAQAVWRAHELAQAPQGVVPTGHAGLDAELPGGGWPCGQLTELLQPQAGLHEWRLLLPALRALPTQARIGLVGCPHVPHLPALACHGLPPAKLLWVQAQTPAERLWCAEQMLRCRGLAAVLLWAPQARPEQLRRLQVAAHSAAQAAAPGAPMGQGPLLFVMRPWPARLAASCAPLRIGLQPAPQSGLTLQLLKRRGPPLLSGLHLAAELPWVPAGAPAARSGLPDAPSAWSQGMAPPLRPAPPPRSELPHVVDRPEPAGRCARPAAPHPLAA